MAMLSSEITNALNVQINAELWSAYLYLSMSLDAADKGLSGVSNWFYVQSREEEDHARIIQHYMNDQGAKVELMPIASVPTSWDTPLDMFNDALAHERKVTSMICHVAKLATEISDYATYIRMQWFITEQIEEESSAREMVNKMELAMNSDSLLYHIDCNMASRRYSSASALQE
ncbi:MAG: ferritin [Bacteroidales bacterium]|nr:ferritin [Bacteroidales bacterium]